MTKAEKKKINKGVLEITNRVRKNGYHNEVVTIKMNLMITGHEAINYKIMKLFAPEITDQELIELTFKMGLRGCTEFLQLVALNNEIDI